MSRSRFARGAALLPGFVKSAEFAEQGRWSRLPSGVRVCVTAPLPLTNEGRLLVIYATPNGNTAEQTLGCAAAAGRDWHFDIQHAAAQVRRLREVAANQAVTLAVVQAPGLSWPAFRSAEKEAGSIIAGKAIPIDCALAYNDVLEAWNYYLEHFNNGRGVVLVGHSQG